MCASGSAVRFRSSAANRGMQAESGPRRSGGNSAEKVVPTVRLRPGSLVELYRAHPDVRIELGVAGYNCNRSKT